MAENFEVVTRTDIEFAEHDGIKLVGDLYLPKGLDKAPMLVGVHGGGWQGQVRELLDFLTWISSFEGFTLRPTIASYS